MLDHVMRCCIYVYKYLMEQYEFSNSCKARMVILPRGLCLVKVKGFLYAIRLSHELNKSVVTQNLFE